jgi:hypothetical protein
LILKLNEKKLLIIIKGFLFILYMAKGIKLKNKLKILQHLTKYNSLVPNLFPDDIIIFILFFHIRQIIL